MVLRLTAHHVMPESLFQTDETDITLYAKFFPSSVDDGKQHIHQWQKHLLFIHPLCKSNLLKKPGRW